VERAVGLPEGDRHEVDPEAGSSFQRAQVKCDGFGQTSGRPRVTSLTPRLRLRRKRSHTHRTSPHCCPNHNHPTADRRSAVLTASQPYSIQIEMGIEDDLHALAAAIVRVEDGQRALLDEIQQLRASMPPRLLSLQDAARERGISPKTMRRRIQAGEVRAERDGRIIRIDMHQFRPGLSDVEAAALARQVRSGTK